MRVSKSDIDLAQLLAAITEISKDAIIITKIDGTVVGWNDNAETLLGYKNNEVAGQPASSLILPSSLDELSRIFDLLKKGMIVREFDTEWRKSDGESIRLSLTAVPLKNLKQQSLAALLVLRNHTNIRTNVPSLSEKNIFSAVFESAGAGIVLVDNEEQCPQPNSALRDQAELSEQELRKQNISLRHGATEHLYQTRTLESLSRLAGGIAHSFNNLLGVIIGHSELILSKIETPYLRQHINEIIAAADRAAAMTRQLLAFSRRQVLRSEVFDLVRVVSDLSAMLRRMIGKDIDMHIDVVAEPLLIRADRGQIEQVIMNLAVNARDAMPHGGKFRIHLSMQHLNTEEGKVQRLQEGHYVKLQVSDTGIGMDKETLNRVFEPFLTTNEAEKGLCLATVLGIVEQSGGRICAESLIGKGTIFTILFPWALSEAEG